MPFGARDRDLDRTVGYLPGKDTIVDQLSCPDQAFPTELSFLFFPPLVDRCHLQVVLSSSLWTCLPPEQT